MGSHALFYLVGHTISCFDVQIIANLASGNLFTLAPVSIFWELSGRTRCSGFSCVFSCSSPGASCSFLCSCRVQYLGTGCLLLVSIPDSRLQLWSDLRVSLSSSVSVSLSLWSLIPGGPARCHSLPGSWHRQSTPLCKSLHRGHCWFSPLSL